MTIPRELPGFLVTPATDDIRHTYTVTPNREAWRYLFAGLALSMPHVGLPEEAIDFAERLLRLLEKGEDDG